jgi:hypothetical protein
MGWLLVAAIACSPDIPAKGPLATVFDSTFGQHPNLSCRTGGNYPAECIALERDTLSFVYTDKAGTPRVVGREVRVGLGQAEHSYRKMKSMLNAQYGNAMVCSAGGEARPKLGWVTNVHVARPSRVKLDLGNVPVAL